MKDNQNKVMTLIACLVLVAAFIAAAVILATRPADNGEPVTIPAETETVTEEAAETETPAEEAAPEAEELPAEEETLVGLEKIRKDGKLVIGMEGNWSPWTYHDEKSGELTGLEVDIANLIAEGIGVTAEFKEAPWDALLAGVNAGRFDIICNGVGYTEDRAKSYNFTTPYVYSNKVLVVADNNEDIKTVDDLKGKKTANSASSTYAALAEEYGATLVPVDTLGETMDMLVQGRVDATINAQVSIADYLKEHPEAKIKIVQILPGDPVAYPLHIGEEYLPLVDAINEILEQARQDGRLAEISMKYFGVDLTKAE